MFRYCYKTAVKSHRNGSRHLSSLEACIEGDLHYVNGSRCQGTGTNVVDVLNPATGKKLTSYKEFTDDDLEQNIDNIKSSFREKWSPLCGTERAEILRNTASVVKENIELITHLEVMDTGKPIWEVRADIEACADTLDYYSGIAQSIKGDYISLANGSFAYTIREPLGLICGIGSFNFPFQMAVWKSAAALACGNAIVYKPSHLTPLTSAVLGECYREAGLPDGCFNVVQGGADTGNALTSRKEFSKVTFTGSVETGKLIMRNCAKVNLKGHRDSFDLKKVTLELGGKSPLIIFDDCNIDNAIKGAMLANFLAQGQVCSNGTRIFVQKSIYSKFVEKFIARTRLMKIGDPFDENTTVGAMISKQQSERVLKYIELAKSEGATIAYGGEKVTPDDSFREGHFLTPAIVTDCTDDMRVVKEEIFGAVACILPFDTESEVVKRANDTDFGLAGGVFTNDLTKAHRVVRSIEAGVLYINTYNAYPPEIPFGGYKQSGIGRENGEAVVEHFTQLKSVIVEMGDVDCGKL